MVDATFEIQGQAGPYIAEHGETITFRVLNKTGIKAIEWEIFGYYHEEVLTLPAFVLQGSPTGSTAQLTLPDIATVLGASYGIRCTVTDSANVRAQATAGVYVESDTGFLPIFAGETTEYDSVRGWGPRINASITTDGASTLAQTLAIGTATGGNDITITPGDEIRGAQDVTIAAGDDLFLEAGGVKWSWPVADGLPGQAIVTDGNRVLSFGTASGFITPENYGARRDGEANDASAIQAAINAAISAGGAVVRLSPGTYRTEDTLTISGSVQIQGPKGAIIQIDGYNQSTIRVLSSAEDVSFLGFTISGDSTGLGDLVTGNDGGHGIAIDAANHVRIQSCTFENIGWSNPIHGHFASPVCAVDVDSVEVLDCDFAATCINRTGADCIINGANVQIIGNRSVSHCDAFASFGNGGEDIRHICTGNIALRDGNVLNRSGIIVAYDGATRSFTDVSHNVLEGFDWHGVYATGDEAGGIICSQNTIRYCGGANSDGGGSWPGAGIKINGLNGSTLEGNIIHGSGLLTDGYFTRDTDAEGIIIYSSTENQLIRGNVISGCTGSGILIDASGAALIRHIVVEGNSIFDNEGYAIELVAQVSSTECITDIQIRGNETRVLNDTAGIKLTANNGGWYNRVNVVQNSIQHTNPPGSGFVGGIELSGYSDFTRYQGQVIGNTIKGFRRGVRLIGVTAHLFCPFALLVDSNTIDATLDLLALDGGSGVWGLHSNTRGNVTSGGRTRPGRSLGVASTASRPRVELCTNLGAPGDGAWVIGDRIDIESPAAGVIGLYCSVAGSPGTWSNITA